ncbi:MAG TPA: cupredoxin family protein [Candidatus Limnocylindria bacterium]|nr:cupredoxin family protein [Candidatus Limnocylindria bacterium]
MKRGMISLAVVVFLFFVGVPGRADESHHGHNHRSAEGHAAAIGMPGNPGDVTRSIEVEMSDAMRFKPDSISVKRGETIRFIVKNTGNLEHEMVLGTIVELKEHAEKMRKSPEMEHDDPNTVSVEPGKTGELIWRFTKDGKVDFACLEPGHLEAGMVGKIVVGHEGK